MDNSIGNAHAHIELTYLAHVHEPKRIDVSIAVTVQRVFNVGVTTVVVVQGWPCCLEIDHNLHQHRALQGEALHTSSGHTRN